MREPRSVSAIAVAAALFGAAVLSGCGGGKPAEPGPTTAATGQTAAATSTPTTAAQQPANDQPGQVDAQEFAGRLAKGLADVKSYTVVGEVEVTMGEQAVLSTITMTFDISDRATPKTHLITELPFGSSETITIGDTSYTRASGETMWTRSTSDLAAEGLSAGDLSDVEASFEPGTTVEFIGTESVNGVQTRRYVIGTPDGPLMDYYLDSKNRPVMLTMSQDGATLRFTFSNFNEPVDISAPPASEVVG